MGFVLQPDVDGDRLRLAGALTIYEAQELKGRLLAHPGALLDLSGVTELDGTGLQLLLLARRDAGARLVAPSAEVSAVLRLTGLTDLIEGPSP